MKKLFIIFAYVNILVLNALVGYLFYHFLIQKEASIAAESSSPQFTIAEDCGEDCVNAIDSIVSQKLAFGPTILTPTSGSLPTKATSVASSKTRRVSYVPIPGSGSTLSNTWVDLPGTDFYLNKSDYPGYLEGYLEVNMKLVNGNGEGFVRLFDVTNGIAVNMSEISTKNQASTFVSSGKIYLWEGSNLYRIQARSLTADTTRFESGRLKIVTEN